MFLVQINRPLGHPSMLRYGFFYTTIAYQAFHVGLYGIHCCSFQIHSVSYHLVSDAFDSRYPALSPTVIQFQCLIHRQFLWLVSHNYMFLEWRLHKLLCFTVGSVRINGFSFPVVILIPFFLLINLTLLQRQEKKATECSREKRIWKSWINY